MKRNAKWPGVLKLTVYAGVASVMFLSCSKNSFEGNIVAVELAGEAGSYEGARLVVIDQKHPEDSPEVLTDGFSSACFPSLSHEGRFLCFQGRQNEGEAWQVWVLDLHKKTSVKVTELEENCTHPVPLPDGSLIFSRETRLKGQTVKELWRCQMDGTGLTQLTFDPSMNHHASVLQEGRVLFNSRVQYPDPQSPVMMVMRPDGTKSELYFNGCCGTYPASDAAESDQGYIYFVGKEGELARVNHKRPLHSFENLSAPLSGSFISVVPDGSECLVSYRPSDLSSFALYRFDPNTREAPSLIYQGEKNLIDPLLVTALPERPRILPSAVDPDNATGLLMSQDINHSEEPVHPGISGDTLADRIRVSTLEDILGIVEVKEDGSFYLKLDADTPFRIECLNKQGEVVRGPSDWIYLRPNERRGCVGCHADPELAPKNFQPLAVKEDPVVLSAKMKEISQ